MARKRSDAVPRECVTAQSGVVRGPSRTPTQGFTLVELLLVILIVGILLALLMGSAGLAWECARDTQCKHNLSQLHKALHMGGGVVFPKPPYWVGFIEKVGAEAALLCPSGGGVRSEAIIPPPNAPPQKIDPEEGVDLPPPDPSQLEQDVGVCDPPASVKIHHFESDTLIRMFCERKDYELPTGVPVNITQPGYYNSFASMTGGSVPGGERVNVYFVHADPVGSPKPGVTFSGQVNFSGEILGIICRDAQLDATDSTLGNPGTMYPTGVKSRGFEDGAEIISLSEDKRSITIHRFHITSVAEQMRIIVRAKSKEQQGSGGPGWAGSGVTWGYDEDEDYGVGGPTSYGMNGRLTPADAVPGQIMLLDYNRTVADVDVDGTGIHDNLDKTLAPRHNGRMNVLFVEGNIESLTPDELKRRGGAPWVGRNKR